MSDTGPVHAPNIDRRNADWYIDKAIQVLVFICGISAIVFIVGIVFIVEEARPSRPQAATRHPDTSAPPPPHFHR